MDRELVRKLLVEAGATRNRDVLADILRTAYDLAGDDADRLDLKITRDALREMRAAYRLFAPYRDVRKVTDVRLGPDAADRPALRPRPGAGVRAGRQRLDRGHRRRARASWRPPPRGRGPSAASA